MDQIDGRIDSRAEIERLEALIEELAAQLETCRKFALASRVSIAAGAVLLLAIVVGAIPFSALAFTAAIATLLGGIVVAGSNRSTANEAAAKMAAAERDRAAMIGLIELRTIAERATLH